MQQAMLVIITRVAVTVRFLATGDSYKRLMYPFRVSDASISITVSGCKCISLMNSIVLWLVQVLVILLYEISIKNSNKQKPKQQYCSIFACQAIVRAHACNTSKYIGNTKYMWPYGRAIQAILHSVIVIADNFAGHNIAATHCSKSIAC
nr:unnamed protein product [Callosobruchus chinensis]